MTDKNLARIAESIEAEGFRRVCDALTQEEREKLGICHTRIGGAFALRTNFVPGFSLNRIVGAGLDAPIREEIIADAMEFYSGHIGKFAFMLTPYAIDEEAERLLAKEKFVHSNSWMRFCRETYDAQVVKGDFVIREISQDEKKIFSEMIAKIFGYPPEVAPLAHSVNGSRDWKFFMAFKDDTAIAGGAVFFSGEAAWIGYAGTLPEFRGIGAQNSIIQARIKAAYEAGCKYVFSETASGSQSQRNMERQGFRLLYERKNYVHSNE